jgi:hypothetical protein
LIAGLFIFADFVKFHFPHLYEDRFFLSTNAKKADDYFDFTAQSENTQRIPPLSFRTKREGGKYFFDFAAK